MRLMSKVALAVVATAALAGSAVAAERAVHTMNVALPDGSVARVDYLGDHPPQIRIVPVAVRPMPVAMIDPAFASFDRLFAAMDAQRNAMLRQAAIMTRTPASGGAIDQAAMRSAPGAAMHYSYVSTTSSGGCTETVRMTSNGSSQQPQVIRTSAGKCDGAKAMPAVVDGAAPATAAPAPAAAAKATPNRIDPNTI